MSLPTPPYVELVDGRFDGERVVPNAGHFEETPEGCMPMLGMREGDIEYFYIVHEQQLDRAVFLHWEYVEEGEL